MKLTDYEKRSFKEYANNIRNNSDIEMITVCCKTANEVGDIIRKNFTPYIQTKFKNNAKEFVNLILGTCAMIASTEVDSLSKCINAEKSELIDHFQKKFSSALELRAIKNFNPDIFLDH